jgi:hypothetical protein
MKKWEKEGKGAHKIMAMGEVAHIDKIRDHLENKFPGQLHLISVQGYLFGNCSTVPFQNIRP